ncbi:hypothetical protein CBL_04102 [Carabus blaptoides fortunei]
MGPVLLSLRSETSHPTAAAPVIRRIFNRWYLLPWIRGPSTGRVSYENPVCGPAGGIEPLRRKSTTGLKPAPQTTEAQLSELY